MGQHNELNATAGVVDVPDEGSATTEEPEQSNGSQSLDLQS